MRSSTKTLVETVDLFPTICELAGLPLPTGPQPIDGDSLVSVLANPEATRGGHAYHCYPRGKRLGRAIRTERFRLVEWKEFGQPVDNATYELYDYENDPLESINLAEKMPDVLERLKKVLARHPEPLLRE